MSSLKKRLKRLKEQIHDIETPDAIPVIFPGDELPENGSYILINVVCASMDEEREADPFHAGLSLPWAGGDALNIKARITRLQKALGNTKASDRIKEIWLVGVEPGGLAQRAGGWIWDNGQYRPASEEEIKLRKKSLSDHEKHQKQN